MLKESARIPCYFTATERSRRISLTSDAGWLLFGSLRQHRLCEGFSSCIRKAGTDATFVILLKLIRQRACRSWPATKTVMTPIRCAPILAQDSL